MGEAVWKYDKTRYLTRWDVKLLGSMMKLDIGWSCLAGISILVRLLPLYHIPSDQLFHVQQHVILFFSFLVFFLYFLYWNIIVKSVNLFSYLPAQQNNISQTSFMNPYTLIWRTNIITIGIIHWWIMRFDKNMWFICINKNNQQLNNNL